MLSLISLVITPCFLILHNLHPPLKLMDVYLLPVCQLILDDDFQEKSIYCG